MTAHPRFKTTPFFVQKYLQLLGIRIPKGKVTSTLQEHPDYPGILSIYDSFKYWGIDVYVLNIDIEKINSIPLPFLTYSDNSRRSFILVTKIDNKLIEFFGADKSRVELSPTEFFKNWSGVCLIANKASAINSGKNTSFKRAIPLAQFLYLFIISSCILSFFCFFNNSFSSISSSVSFLLKAMGIAICISLLSYEWGESNPILKKICTMTTKSSCETVLTSKHSKVFKWLSWSEVGLFYFGSGFVAFVVSNSLLPGVIFLSAFINSAAVPYIVYSILYQKLVIKRWCPLCLMIQGILALEFAANIYFKNYKITTSYQNIVLAGSLIILILTVVVTLYYAIKYHYNKYIQASSSLADLYKLKFNPENFSFLLSKQKKMINVPEQLGIRLGNRDAKHFVLKVCNPYCAPCSRSHADLIYLLESSNIELRIIYTTTMQKNDPRIKPVLHFLALNSLGDKVTLKQALNDWYLSENKNYEEFARKYPLPSLSDAEYHKEQIKEMNQWCQDMLVDATPTFFVNGHQLPDSYKIKDLKYFFAT